MANPAIMHVTRPHILELSIPYMYGNVIMRMYIGMSPPCHRDQLMHAVMELGAACRAAGRPGVSVGCLLEVAAVALERTAAALLLRP